MDTRVFCVYNLARGVFLSSKVTTADGVNEPLKILKVLVGGLGLDGVSGLWICPLSAIPSVPRLFPFDFIYLDRDQRVIEATEIVPGADFPPYRSEVASALVLARRTVLSTQTEPGDRLIICVDSEIDRQIAAAGASDAEAIVANAPSPARPKGAFKRNGKENGTATSVASLEPFSALGVAAMEPPANQPAMEQAVGTVESQEASAGGAKDAVRGEAQVIETGFERPESGQSVVTGQQGGVEDLFSNWVDAPSSTAWMPHNPRPGNAPATPPAPAKAASAPASTETHKAAPEIPAVPPKPPIPVKSPQATTSTVANYGMWRVSPLTAVGPIAAVPSQGDKGAVAPVAVKQAEKETRDQEPSPVAKRADSEDAASKPGQDKAVQPLGAAMQGIAERIEAVARSGSAGLKSLEPSAAAAKASANDVPAKKLLIETAKDSGAAERPKVSQASATANDGVQKSPSDVPTVKTVVSQSAASALKTVKAVSKAVVPVKSAAPKVQPKTSIGRTEANGRSETGPLSLGTRLKRWLNPVAPAAGDRRRAHRRYVPGMVAHYYTGGSPKPYQVADISMSGFYLLTEDRWMPETMIQMTLQKPCAKGERKQSIAVLSKIVRRGSDGVAARFVMPEDLDPQSHDIQPSQATDKFTLARFL